MGAASVLKTPPPPILDQGIVELLRRSPRKDNLMLVVFVLMPDKPMDADNRI